MTSKGAAGNALKKKGKSRTDTWPPPPLIVPSPPEPDVEIARGYSAVANRFYGDFRSSIYRMSSELGAAQVSGMLFVDPVEAQPRGTMPGALWDKIRSPFEDALRDLLLGQKNAAEIAAEDVVGRCRLRLWLAPPDVLLALQRGLRHTLLEMGQFDQRIRDLPGDYAARYKELQELSHEFRTEVARQLGPAMNAHLKKMPQDSYAEKQALASWVNGQLRALGLAIKCPKTGRPANLVADIKQAGSDVSRFRLEIRDERGKKTRTFASRELPELELMEDEPRQEPLLKWSERVRQSRRNRKRE